MTSFNLGSQTPPANVQFKLGRFASSAGLGQSIEFLEELVRQDPGNKALLDAYVELCKKDADMQNAAETRRVEVMNNAANERLNLLKLDAEGHKKLSDNLLGINKAVLDCKDRPANWPYFFSPTPVSIVYGALPLKNNVGPLW